jgi:hypothetical protein
MGKTDIGLRLPVEGSVSIEPRRLYWILLYVLFVGIAIFIAFPNQAYDDPFISYRYAFNLSHGYGLVYNIGEKSMSTTSPLFVLILTMISPICSDIPKVANLIGAFSVAAAGILLWDLAITWKSPITGWLALFILPTFPLMISTLGSETPLYVAFCLAAFAFYARHKFSLCAVMASLATLIRLDGALLLILLAVGYIYTVRHSISWKIGLLILGIILPWFLFAWYYYGSPVPLTLVAKQHQGSMAISERFAPGLVTILRGYTNNYFFQIEIVLAILGFLSLFMCCHQWILFIAWQILYFCSYSILGVSRYFWYYAPLVPGFITLVGQGLSAIPQIGVSIIEKVKLQTFPYRKLISTLIILLGTILFISQVKQLNGLRKVPDSRYPIYREAGEWLNTNTPEDASVGTLEVGIIGYFSQRTMIDFAGLIQPDIADQLTPTTTYSDAAYWAIEHYRPDYLVFLEGTFPTLEMNLVAEQCKVVHRILGINRGREVNLVIHSCNYTISFSTPKKGRSRI